MRCHQFQCDLLGSLEPKNSDVSESPIPNYSPRFAQMIYVLCEVLQTQTSFWIVTGKLSSLRGYSSGVLTYSLLTLPFGPTLAEVSNLNHFRSIVFLWIIV